MDKYENFNPAVPTSDDYPPFPPEPSESRERKEPVERKVVRKKKKTSQKGSGNTKETKGGGVTEKRTPVSTSEPLWPKIVAAVKSPHARILTGIFLGCLAVYLLVSFLSYFVNCVRDQSVINSVPIGSAGKVANAGGEGGARLSEFLINECFGLGSAVIIFWLGAISLKLLAGKPRFKTLDFTIKCFVALITISLIIGLVTFATHTMVNWGGYHGRYVNEFIINFVGVTGAILLCIFLIALFIVICLRDLVNWLLRLKHERDEKRRVAREEKAARLAREEEIRKMQDQEKIDDLKAGEAASLTVKNPEKMIDADPETYLEFSPDDAPIYSIEVPDPDDYVDEGPDYRRPEPGSTEGTLLTDHSESVESVSSDPLPGSHEVQGEDHIISPTDNSEPAQEDAVTESEEMSADLLPESAEATKNMVNSDTAEITKQDEKMVVNVNNIGQSEQKHFKSEVDRYEDHPYKFPPYDLLRPGVEKISVDLNEQAENKERIRKTLLDFGIPIVSIEATVGPTVTLYEIIPDKGVKIARIRNLVDDLALSLAANGVRIIAPIPGKGSVGIEVANKDPQMVSMRTIIKSEAYQRTKYHLPLAIGSTISNQVYIADLAKMPHLLVGGATGQGKSVGLNAIIASLLYCLKPYQLKFVMIDPKQVEFSLYNKIKDHYLAMIPDGEDAQGEVVITDMAKVEATLNSLCIEMDNRYTLLKSAHTRNLEEYNEKIRQGLLNPAEGHRFLPYIVVIVDEFGDLVMVAGKNVETPIARLAQKARAVGMHVIIATQRPSANVITGIIKANFPARISFKVSSGIDSKTVLDSTGAQHLIGRGDMLIFHSSEMTRVQCAFIDTPEVEALCDYIQRQPYPSGPYILPEPTMSADGENAGAGGGQIVDSDPLLPEVARAIVSSGNASTSAIQRQYSIGYNRAGRIMDQLEALGVVGPSQGGKPRQVLIDPMGLEDLLATLGK